VAPTCFGKTMPSSASKYVPFWVCVLYCFTLYLQLFIIRMRLYFTIQYYLWPISYSCHPGTDELSMKCECVCVWIYVCMCVWTCTFICTCAIWFSFSSVLKLNTRWYVPFLVSESEMFFHHRLLSSVTLESYSIWERYKPLSSLTLGKPLLFILVHRSSDNLCTNAHVVVPTRNVIILVAHCECQMSVTMIISAAYMSYIHTVVATMSWKMYFYLKFTDVIERFKWRYKWIVI
jgi:hypothetical protein